MDRHVRAFGPVCCHSWLCLAQVRLCLVLHVCILFFFIPFFVSRIGYYYLTDKHIKRNIRYGTFDRNLIDIFVPPQLVADREKKGGTNVKEKKYPVVVYVTGGGSSLIFFSLLGTL
jgi:hypothetical protein